MPSPSIPMRVPAHRPDRFDGLVAPAVALLVYAALHREGVAMAPDSWAYWEGALSIASGHGYTYFSGLPILSWPPLYSAYLAIAAALAGPTGGVLVAANAVLIGGQAVLWRHLALVLARDSSLSVGLAVGRAPALLVSLFVGLFVAVHQQVPFSQQLVYLLLPLFLLSVWRLATAEPPPPIPSAADAAAVALAVLLLLTHTSTIAFIVAGALPVAVAAWRAPARLATAAAIVGLPLLAWLGERAWLGQDSSHCVGLGVARFGPASYAVQLVDGLGRLLVPDRAGTTVVAAAVLALAGLVLAATARPARGLRFALAVSAVAAGVLFALFNLAWIFAGLGGRFLLFLPLLLVPQVGLVAGARRPAVASTLLLLAVLPQAYWAATWAFSQAPAAEALARAPMAYLPLDGIASRDYLTGPPVRRDGRLLVAPYHEPEIEGACR